jgi:hypothetical protein
MKTKNPVNKTRTSVKWTRLSKESLLNLRLCDLNLSLTGSLIEPKIKLLNKELDRKGIQFKPHFWISDDWFCPDGIPGIAIPFFLVHPKLKKIEKDFVMEVEGGDHRWCMKLLRHETAHAIANAYKLTNRKDWRKIFGNPNAAYHDSYLPKPYSKRFVINLPGWYAQSHAHEDWAETFAIWLKPNSDWKIRYANWPALKKLKFVDQLMDEVRYKKPPIRNKRIDHPIEKIRTTLQQYYEDKMQRYGIDHAEFFDIDLRKLFATSEESPVSKKASRYIREIKKPVMDIVQRWTGEYKYRINEVLQDMIKRCDELDLRFDDRHRDMFPDMTSCVTMLVMNKLHSGGFNITR